MRSMRVVVVGAGVLGLSAAVRLLQAGHDVRIVARERTPRTTSDVAAAVHFPYRSAPMDRVVRWARATHEALARIAGEAPEAGVVMMDILAPTATRGERPWWLASAGNVRPARPEELPRGAPDGWVLHGAVIEMQRYMRWLEARATELGATFETRVVTDLAAEASAPGVDALVHAAGLGARELARDPLVHPVRGQIARVRNPGLTRAILDEATPRALAYTIPRSDGVVCGGTADVDAWDLAYDEACEREILAKAVEMEPALAGCEVVARGVGLRPARDTVRLERDGRIVHCYGHGGSGVTLSWGCADEVVRLLGPPAHP